ncbi:hypothetical protein FRB99_008620 [Tulasnella sp. 403]|nr:hypothetical protein FRB99_008620 [Tulasnella sp. 403]
MDMWMSKRTREEKDAVLKQVELMEQHRRDLYMHALNKVKFPGDMAEKIWKRTFEVRRQKRSRNLKMREERLGRSVVRERGARGKRRISPLRNEIGMDCDEVEVEAPKTAWKWQGLMRRWVVNAMRGDSDP